MNLEILKQREQLMEDIDCIVSAQYGQGNEDLADEMIKLLCDAVCKNFSVKWRQQLQLIQFKLQNPMDLRLF